MAYKNVQHYRHTVHRYLDAIWQFSSKKSSARSSMYKVLSQKMNLPIEETHASKFSRTQCKQAIAILRPMYIQLFGEDLPYNKSDKVKRIKENINSDEIEVKKMYYSERTFDAVVLYKESRNTVGNVLTITIYCSAKKLNDNNNIIDLEIMELDVRKFLEEEYIKVNKVKPTLEMIAENICDRVLPSYKVTVICNNDKVTYEEIEV